MCKKLKMKKPPLILGATHGEALGVFDIVLERSKTENVVCVFDQNLAYAGEETVLGTDIVKRLRAADFRGPIFIRHTSK